MAFERPTLQELIDRIEADIVARLGINKPLRNSLVRILSRASAGSAHGQYGYIDFLSKQVIPDQAVDEYLDRWCSMYSVERLPADFATGDVVFTGTNGTEIPAGTIIVRSDGAEYETGVDATISSGAATVSVTATTAGDDANTDADTTLSLSSAISGIDASVTVDTGGISGGSDIETDDSLRARLIARLQDPPTGGSESDYEQWAQSADSAVTRVWIAPQEMGAGTVTVRIAADASEDAPEASSDVVDAVEAYIEPRRPVTATVYVVSVSSLALDFEISVEPNTSSVQAAVAAELVDMLLRDGEPGGTIYLSRINEAISIAAGETDHTLISPTEDIVLGAGQVPTLGDITWSP